MPLQDRYGNPPLHFASDDCNIKIIELLLGHKVNVKAQRDNGETPLHVASRIGYLKIVEKLLNCRAIINLTTEKAYTPLHYAVENGHLEITKLFLKNNAYVNTTAIYGITPLHTAAERGYVQIAEVLLNHGARINSTTWIVGTPLHFASKNKQEEMAKLLIKNGANVNAKNATEKTPLSYATDLNIIKLLLKNGANVNESSEVLNTAVWNNCKEIVEVLLQHGANINARDTKGETALHYTTSGKRFKSTNEFKFSSKEKIIKGEIARLLLSRGANVNAQNHKGTTTLHYAVQRKYASVVKALLEYNVDVNCNNGLTPLFFCRSVEMYEMLLSKGAHVNVKDKDDGSTPLHHACLYMTQEILDILLKFGADIDAQNDLGETPLHVASKGGNRYTHTTRWLLDYGSDINIKCYDNHTPLDSALPGGSTPLILQKQIVMMKAANLYLSNENLQSLRTFNETSDFQYECEEELERMKSEEIGNNVSFCDFLTNDINKLVRYVRKDKIVQVLKSNVYKTKFTIYASMINCFFKKGMERNELLEQSSPFFNSFFDNFYELPFNCCEQIISYLNNNDLRNLINASIK